MRLQKKKAHHTGVNKKHLIVSCHPHVKSLNFDDTPLLAKGKRREAHDYWQDDIVVTEFSSSVSACHLARGEAHLRFATYFIGIVISSLLP